MGQILNEELFRIREIMGVINENYTNDINNLVSEQASMFADLLQGAAGLSRIDGAGISVVDDAVQTATQSLSRVANPKVPKTYDTLEELVDGIIRKEIPENVADDIAQTVIKRIIATPEGSKLIAKTWFVDNAPTAMKKAVSKNLDNLPPRLINKIYKDYEILKGTINTGDSSLDDSVKNSLDDVYGTRISSAKSNADEAIRMADELDDKYNEIRAYVRNKINSDPDLSRRKIKDWFGTYEDEVKKLIETKTEKDARDYLFNQLSKPSIWARIKNMFSGEGWYKTLEYVRKKGVTLGISTATLIIVGVMVYYVVSGMGETIDTVQGDTYTKIKIQYPTLKDAPTEIIDKFISAAPKDDIDYLILKKEGYSLDYKVDKGTPLGDMRTFTVVTPSKTYQYRMDENDVITDESPKKDDISQSETFEVWISKTSSAGGGGGYGPEDYTNMTTNQDGSVTVEINGSKYTAKKGTDGKWSWQ